MFEEALLKTGAVKGANTVTIENEAEEEDVERIIAFAKALLEKHEA